MGLGTEAPTGARSMFHLVMSGLLRDICVFGKLLVLLMLLREHRALSNPACLLLMPVWCRALCTNSCSLFVMFAC
jgi:hypothetical protein